MRWRAASNATGYKVQWKAGDQNYAASRQGIVTGTRYKIANLLGGTTYTVRVIATKTGAPDSRPSAEQTGVLALLGSPTVMVAAKVDTLTVTWNAVDDATGYKVQWKSGAATYPTSDLALATHGQATISDGRTTTYKISGLTAGTTYTIRVIATSTNINLADSAPSEEVMVTSATTKPHQCARDAGAGPTHCGLDRGNRCDGIQGAVEVRTTDLQHLFSPGDGLWREHHDLYDREPDFWHDLHRARSCYPGRWDG